MNILEQIREAEQQAVDIRAGAAARAREIVRQADRQGEEAAEVILADARTRCDALLADRKAESRRAADAYIEKQAKAGAAALDALRSKTGAAAQSIVEGILRP